jgi:hypothetical protein
MTRCLFFIFLTFSPYAFCGSIKVAQWMPWNFVKHSHISQAVQLSFQNQNFSPRLGEFTPKMSLEGSLHGTMKEIQFFDGGVSVRHDLSVRIKIDRLFIDQIIRREVAGNIFDVRIEAECSPFTIEVPLFNASADLDFESTGDSISPALKDIRVTIADEQWKVEEIECRGIGNLGEEIKNQITNALRNPERFENVLNEWAGSAVKSTFQSLWTSLLNSTEDSLRITSLTKPSSKGFFLLASLPVSKDEIIDHPELSEENLSSEIPQFMISLKGFEALLEEKLKKLMPANYNLQEILGFRDLMSSRFKQYMVWPDLQRFPKNQAFHLSTEINHSRLVMRKENTNFFSVWFNTNGSLKTVIGGSPIDYVLFGMGLKTRLNVRVINGEMIFTTSQDGEVSLAWNFGLLYQMLYRPDNRISVEVLKNSLLSFFKNQTVKESLPVIRIHDRTYKLTNWKQTNDSITMDWL